MTIRLPYRLILAAALAAGLLLAACTPAPATTPPGDTPAPAPTRTSPPAATPTAEPTIAPTATVLPHLQLRPEDLSGTRITFWHPWSGELGRAVQGMVDEFNDVNTWGIRVTASAPGSSGLLYEAVSAALDGSERPNIVAAPMDQIVAWHQREGVIINLNDYLEDAVWGLNAQERADIPRAFLDQGELGGRRYGLPGLRMPELLFYNVSWAQELGFANPPGSLDEFERQACAAATANRSDSDTANDGTGGWIVNTDPLVQMSWLHSSGFDGFTAGEALRFNRGATRQMFTFFRHMFDRGCAWSARLPEPYEYFSTRRALFYSGTLADLSPQQFTDRRMDNADRWMLLPYPPSNGGRPVVVNSGVSYAILASEADEQLAAWLFMRWMMLPVHQAALAEATGAWPASAGAIAGMEAFRADNPAWESSLMWMPVARSAPVHPDWRVARGVFSDAAWQLYQSNIKLEDIPNLLSILDATVEDVVKNQ